MSQIVIRGKENKDQIRHHASMLYYDLKSIEEYIKNEKSSVNIRYYTNWQETVAKCNFFTSDDIKYIYNIYDIVYNYNYNVNKIPFENITQRSELIEHKKLEALIGTKELENILKTIENQGIKY